jgi:thymidylate synthase (FAD)
MPVKLISYTKTADESQSLLDVIAYCARVSNPANQNNTQTNEKLVRYLIKNNHWSPLEMVNVCLEIETTRDIGRQILRHRSFSFQEFSQRYAVADLGFECKEARMQDTKNRQNSIKTNNTDLEQEWTKQQTGLAEHAQTAYNWALENGIAKEQARAVLPEGMTTTKMYMSGTLRSWVHYISLRHANGTQKEHSDIAIECAKAIQPIFPMISEFVSTISISDVDKKYETLVEM